MSLYVDDPMNFISGRLPQELSKYISLEDAGGQIHFWSTRDLYIFFSRQGRSNTSRLFGTEVKYISFLVAGGQMHF